MCEQPCSVPFFESVSWNSNRVLEFLLDHEVFKSSTRCERCGSVCVLDRDKLLFRCQRRIARRKQATRRCTFKKSARVGSFLERSRLPLEKYFKLVSVLLHLTPPRQALIERELHVTSHTVVDWYSFCREVFIYHVIDTSQKIGGPNTIVEIDEAKFGRRKYNRGRLIEGQWVFGGIQRNSGNTFLVPVESRDSATLLNILREWVLPGTTIVSDCWKAYNCLEEEGFRHFTVNHSVNFVDPDTGAHTNTIERVWREVRAKIPRFGVRKNHFVGYLAELQFKIKYPKFQERLHMFFKAAAKLYPSTN